MSDSNDRRLLDALWVTHILDVIVRGSTVKLQFILETTGNDIDVSKVSTKCGLFGLYLAASQGHTHIVQLLLEYGADVNQRTMDGYTALHAACQRNHNKSMRLLLDSHANVDAAGPNNAHAIHFATQYGHHELVELLIQFGAKLNVKVDDTGLTPLMIASQLGLVEIVTLLVLSGADLDAEDVIGNTALHFAARVGNHNIAYILLAAGADAYILNMEDDNPIDLAIYHGHTNVVCILEKIFEPASEEVYTSGTKTFYRNQIIAKNRRKYARFHALDCILEENLSFRDRTLVEIF
uniref:Uncharacterized protein AlNc14C24G2435 n=1 Tax=Albugo laibachii Nc14 TaxID=890382 RepID=F0W6D5_9STRA|nr:conserved hypothetical protein [Albugo laibachii Nc14]|eukprot:CCA16679.1 conserved hypothetical protein [Albugo laibachii Nc14]